MDMPRRQCNSPIVLYMIVKSSSNCAIPKILLNNTHNIQFGSKWMKEQELTWYEMALLIVCDSALWFMFPVRRTSSWYFECLQRPYVFWKWGTCLVVTLEGLFTETTRRESKRQQNGDCQIWIPDFFLEKNIAFLFRYDNTTKSLIFFQTCH